MESLSNTKAQEHTRVIGKIKKRLDVNYQLGASDESIDKLKQAISSYYSGRKDIKAKYRSDTLLRSLQEKDSQIGKIKAKYVGIATLPASERKIIQEYKEAKKVIVFDEYTKHLNENNDVRDFLFEKGFVIKNDEIFFKDELVGKFIDASFAFFEKNARKVYKRGFSKNEKDYIQDSRGVYTRRFAYVEKNYYQIKDLLDLDYLTGRFQKFQSEIGMNPNIHEIEIEEYSTIINEKPNEAKKSIPNKLSVEEVALLHNYFGNGLQQRGVSLTSTASRDAVYSNDGDTFKDALRGARIKVDLSKIPEDILLVNHYSEGGTSEYATKNKNVKTFSMLDKEKGYSYASCVVKNREIYLEKLSIDWIEEIELHMVGKESKTIKNDRTTKEFKNEIKEYMEYDKFNDTSGDANANDEIVNLGRNFREKGEQGRIKGEADFTEEKNNIDKYLNEISRYDEDIKKYKSNEKLLQKNEKSKTRYIASNNALHNRIKLLDSNNFNRYLFLLLSDKIRQTKMDSGKIYEIYWIEWIKAFKAKNATTSLMGQSAQTGFDGTFRTHVDDSPI